MMLYAPKLILDDQKERLILTNQAKIHPGPLLNGALLIAKISHLRIKPVISGSQLRILCPLLGNRLLQGPHLRKAGLPDPQANLQQEYQHYQNGPKRFHAESVQKMNNKVSERSEEHTSELQSRENLVCRLLLETKQE